MITYDVNITPARVVRHAASAQGRDAAIIDIAQDLLLRHLDDVGLLAELAFKGGTALRKLYAGNEGRFSLTSTSPYPRSRPFDLRRTSRRRSLASTGRLPRETYTTWCGYGVTTATTAASTLTSSAGWQF